jgi:hypothetical protein
VFLLRASKARNPRTPGFIRILAIVGGIGAAFSGVISAVVIAIKANDFVSHGNQTYEQAHAVTTSAVLVVPQILVQASALLIAISVVMVCVHAMRVGLLTRFLGYLGMFAGALIIIPIVQLPVVQAYWLAAVAYLLYGSCVSSATRRWASRHDPSRAAANPRPSRSPWPNRWRPGRLARPRPSASASADTEFGAPAARPGRRTSVRRASRRGRRLPMSRVRSLRFVIVTSPLAAPPRLAQPERAAWRGGDRRPRPRLSRPPNHAGGRDCGASPSGFRSSSSYRRSSHRTDRSAICRCPRLQTNAT